MAQPGPSKASLWKGKLALAIAIVIAIVADTAVVAIALLFGASSKLTLLVVLDVHTMNAARPK